MTVLYTKDTIIVILYMYIYKDLSPLHPALVLYAQSQPNIFSTASICQNASTDGVSKTWEPCGGHGERLCSL